MAAMVQALMEELESRSRGFRTRYLPYDELTAQLTAWRDAFPTLVQLGSLGRSREGRELWMLTIGPRDDHTCPALWVDGNMHASELCGSSVALAIAEDALRLHLAPDAELHGLPAHLRAQLRGGVRLHVVPRLCPDGAEQVLTTGRWVRSNPHDDRGPRAAPHWRFADVDGDGTILLMRQRDAAGDYVESSELPGVMLPRRIEDAGPYFRLYPEGLIEGFDGVTIPEPDYLSDASTDLNRNFAEDWAPEPRQRGAGPFPGSEPEAHAVMAFAARHPNVFAWVNFHSYGGVYIRPCGDRPDSKMNQHDLAVYRQIEAWTDALTTYPTVSAFEEFTYEPDKPLHGDIVDFAYAQRGALALTCELWDLFRATGVPIRRPFVHNYARRSREDALAIARWDRTENAGRATGSWRPFDHPQLGPVDVGGYDPRLGMWNPPPERLAGICTEQAAVVLRIAALAPRLQLVGLTTEPIGDGLTRIRASVENTGYLPTYVLASAKDLPHTEPVRATLMLPDTLRIVAGAARQTVGHLGGWGGFDKAPLLGHPSAWSSGEPPRRPVEWVVSGHGEVVLRAGCPRTGVVERRVTVRADR